MSNRINHRDIARKIQQVSELEAELKTARAAQEKLAKDLSEALSSLEEARTGIGNLLDANSALVVQTENLTRANERLNEIVNSAASALRPSETAPDAQCLHPEHDFSSSVT